MNMKTILIWFCALYFAFLFMSNIVYVTWGTLGIIRPSDMTDGMIDAEHARVLVHLYARPLQRLVWLLGLGTLFLLGAAIMISKKEKNGMQNQPSHRTAGTPPPAGDERCHWVQK